MNYTEFAKRCEDRPEWLRNKIVVVDESHYYKNSTPHMEVSLKALKFAKHVLFLTGTPLVNDLVELIVYVLFCFAFLLLLRTNSK